MVEIEVHLTYKIRLYKIKYDNTKNNSKFEGVKIIAKYFSRTQTYDIQLPYSSYQIDLK